MIPYRHQSSNRLLGSVLDAWSPPHLSPLPLEGGEGRVRGTTRFAHAGHATAGIDRLRNRFWSLLAAFLILIFMSLGQAWGHEIVGEVTPLMLHMNHTLTFIKNGRSDEAMQMAKRVYEDFQEPMRQGKEAGLKTNSERIDRVFGTSSRLILINSIEQKNPNGLLAGVQLMSFLLMLEKFDVLQTTFEKKNANGGTRETIFWLGRNYFSYLLEPTMGEKDPIEEKRLDRLLDRMLYSVQDGEWETFVKLREELTDGIMRFFDLPIPKLPVEASKK